MYWALYTVDSQQLFPGASQYDRFRKQLRALLEDEQVAAELHRRGVSPQDVGTHSIRKGSATYCSSGSTACPSATAVHLRAGWSLGGVQNTYLRYQAAGDMHVGRTVAGLPTNSEQFAMLPPRFAVGDDVVRAGVQELFGIVPLNMQFVCEHALASLVYHHGFLLATLGATHQLFRSPLYQDAMLLQRLRDRVSVGVAQDHGQHASGIPPHCAMLDKLRSLEDAVHRVETTVVDRVIEAVHQAMSTSGEINGIAVRNAIADSFQAFGLPELMERLRQQAPAPAVPEDDDGDGSTTFLYDWQGRFRRLPENSQFPDCTPRQMWVLWTCGSSSAKLPPLRYVQSSDLSSSNARKRLSDVRFLMRHLESAASTELGWSARRCGVTDACSVYDRVSAAIALPIQTRRGRHRRRTQLSWRSVANALRESLRDPP